MVAKEGGRSKAHFLLIHDAGVHQLQNTMPVLEGDPSHEADQTPGSDDTEMPKGPYHRLQRGQEGRGRSGGLFHYQGSLEFGPPLV